MRVFCLRVYSFLICWFSFGVFGDHFVLLGATLGLLWGALGSQGALLGVTLDSLLLPWDSVGPFGDPWAPKGSLG